MVSNALSFQKVLVANRGEVAVRIARAAHELGITPIGVFAEEDASLAARYPMDVHPLHAPGTSAYLNIEALIDRAQIVGCDAVHPGYGLLSENAAFAAACQDAGLQFIGPPAAVLETLGQKPAARRLAAELEIPLLPGTDDGVSLFELEAQFDALAGDAGIMIKASLGGGGRGMRSVTDRGHLAECFERCRSEALRAFGSDRLYAERLVRSGRHIEVQVVADRHGGVTHLGERECSLQRQHQKLIEIAPSPTLSASLRTQIIDAALKLARHVRYENIGTFEFLVDGDAFYFLEANPRLQVEHPVTEAVTGVDLVETQFHLAAGRRLADLGLDRDCPRTGWALEARLYAEQMNETGQAVPTTGTISRLTWPTGPGVRIDTAAFVGAEVSTHFDALVAKLVVYSGQSFAGAVRKLRHALQECEVEGVASNLPFLRVLANRAELETNRVSIQFIQSHASNLIAELHPDPPSEPIEAKGEISAPFAGMVLEVMVTKGEEVQVGQVLGVLESMKMEHEIRAPSGGRVEAVLVTVKTVVEPGTPLFQIQTEEAGTASEPTDTSIDLSAVRPDLAETQLRHARLEDDFRPDAVRRRRDRNQRTARENLTALCDPGSFLEYGALAIAAQKSTRPLEDLQNRTPGDGVITGLATINGAEFGSERGRSAVVVVDATVLAGTQGYFHHRKLDRIFELAETHRLPVVMFAEGGGGRPNDTDLNHIMVSGLNVPSFRTFAGLSGQVPRIAIVSGYCFAGNAALAGCADLLIGTEQSYLGMGGPAMIEGGGLGRFEPHQIGPADVQFKNGVLDVLVADETKAAAAARKLLGYFQGRLDRCDAPDQRRLRHLIPENRRRVYDARGIVETLIDVDSGFELRAGYGQGILTYLARIDGRPVGLIANNPQHLGGAIDPDAAEKCARFLQLCDAFDLPVVSLCDTPGFMVGPAIETEAQVRKVSRMFTVGAHLTVPFFTVIVRKAYGLGAQAMAAGGFSAPVFTIAWPSGELGGMGLEGAVQLGFRKQLAAIEDPKARQALFDRLVGELYERGKALSAASVLELDAVIDPEKTRDWLIQGLERCTGSSPKTRRFVDTW